MAKSGIGSILLLGVGAVGVVAAGYWYMTTYYDMAWNQDGVESAIIATFLSKGYSLNVARAALCNVYGESGFNVRAIGDSGASVGVYQLSESGGGKTIAIKRDTSDPSRVLYDKSNMPWNPKIWGQNSGLSKNDPRFCPIASTICIIDNEVAQKAGARLIAADKAGKPVSELAAIFCSDIERPADVAGGSAKRAAYAVKRGW